MKPNPGEKKLYFTTIAEDFDALMDPYDLRRRLEVFFDELLPADLAGKALLDIGCGTGWFSARAQRQGAKVTSLDLGLSLLRQVKKKTPSQPVAGDALLLPFKDSCFDLVISSEMVEHTFDPPGAIHEMARVLRPGGLLALSCPNRLWLPVVRLASLLRLRPFHGHEDFPTYRQLENYSKAAGLLVERHEGFHPWPFQVQWLTGISRWLDLSLGKTIAGRWMINQAIRAVKQP
jgi:2-polyprenyl-3-methyl-5-hydroxy-6-metoxy-1,4-benzoquinol methylase